MKIYGITVHGVSHEMQLLTSDVQGFYLYKLIPMELGYEPKLMYIAPNREAYWMYGKPMEGKLVDSRNISHFYTYK